MSEEIADLAMEEQKLERQFFIAIAAKSADASSLWEKWLVARQNRTAACFARNIENGLLQESEPIPPRIQGRILEILTERGFIRDGKIVRRPSR